MFSHRQELSNYNGVDDDDDDDGDVDDYCAYLLFYEVRGRKKGSGQASRRGIKNSAGVCETFYFLLLLFVDKFND